MKRILAGLVLAAAAYAAYRYFAVDAPIRVYARFAEAWVREDTPAAVALTDGKAAKEAVESKILRGVCQAPMEAYRGWHHRIESRVPAPGGELALTAHVIVFYDPPGVTSALGGAMKASFRHVVRMEKTEAGWRVAEFEPEFLEAVPVRRGE